MAHFYGYLKGNRGAITRCGSKNSGINVHIKSCDNDVEMTLSDDNGEDSLNISITEGLKIKINGKEIDFSNIMVLRT